MQNKISPNSWKIKEELSGIKSDLIVPVGAGLERLKVEGK